MKFNIGDKVRFLNDVGGGKVIKYLDNETVIVLTDDDFEMPVPANELIFDANSGYDKISNEKILQETKKESKFNSTEIPEQFENDKNQSALFLAFVPIVKKKNTDGDLRVFLVNDSNYNVTANILLQYGALYVSHPKSVVPNTKLEVKDLYHKELNDIDSIVVQLILYKSEPHKFMPAVTFEAKLNPVKFFSENTFTENDFFDEPAYLLTIYDDSKPANSFPDIRIEELKEAFREKEVTNVEMNKKPVSKTSKTTEVWEIDLHINELLDDITGMAPKEIIDYQMDCFRKEMQNAINERIKKVIFIHGKGDGVLKSEIRKELKTNYRKYQFQDASFQQYGFGATAVYIS